MKKTILIMGSIVLSVLGISVEAQVTETQPTQNGQTWDYRKNPTVAAITSQYEGKYITTKTSLTDADIFPALGKYVSSADGPALNIVLDEQSKGVIWIEGLSQGKIRAILRKSPATYKIPAQKTESGVDIPEGTLIYDKENNVLNIITGKNYNSEDPSLAFAPEPEPEQVVVKTKNQSSKTKVKTESKPKTWTWSGTKLVETKEENSK